MKTNFKKTLAVLLAILMLTSVFSITAFAATYTAKIQAGSAEGSTLKEGITTSMLSLKSNNSGKVKLPSEAYYERENYVQDGWTTTKTGGGKKLGFGTTQTLTNNRTIYYPYWKQTTFVFTFGAGNDYDVNDPANYTDATMSQVKEFVIKTDGTEAITLPGAMFTRAGYEQIGWCFVMTSDGTTDYYELNSVYPGEITEDVNLYPFWKANNKKVSFLGGADGVGTAEDKFVPYGDKVVAPGAIFTRDGYTQIGWTSTEGSDVVELALGGAINEVFEDMDFYPVWRLNIYGASVQPTDVNLGKLCTGYGEQEGEDITITNEGNVPLTFTLPTSSAFEFTVKQGSLTINEGESVVINVKPVAGLAVAKYEEELEIACDSSKIDISVKVVFEVVDHVFSRYVSNNDASYKADGTKTATCSNGCGAKDTIDDVGSKKVYSIDNNTVTGLSSTYEYHRTVRFSAFGSGMDAKTNEELGKRFRPVAWYVNEEFSGEFEDGYDVVFTHTLFGNYTLTVNYVEEVYDETTKEWVATEVTDTKTFNYTVGTTAEEEQEIVVPNTILSLIFGLFAELLKLLGLGG